MKLKKKTFEITPFVDKSISQIFQQYILFLAKYLTPFLATLQTRMVLETRHSNLNVAPKE
jgi:hypothetical protein